MSLNQSVSTTITAGNPFTSSTPYTNHNDSNPFESSISTSTTTSATDPADLSSPQPSQSDTSSPEGSEPQTLMEHRRHKGRAENLTTATTTITQTTEPMSPRYPASLIHTLSIGEIQEPQEKDAALQELGAPPHARGLLLLAEMSSAGNLMTQDYTEACVKAARENKEFVVGFVSQRTLNSETDDAFLSFAPGVSLPAEGEIDGIKSDGKGQQWRGPEEVIGKAGIDVCIVGRGILGAADRGREARRYRKAAWEAYEGRIGRT